MLVRFLVREGLGVAVLGLVLFLPAGRLDWPMGWALVAITGLWIGAMGLVMAVWQPDLIAERLGPKPGTKRWDVVILSLLGLLAIARCVVAGLDVRFGWTTAPPWLLQGVALLVAVGGYGLVVWATAANAFFAATARIQAERGQTVATDGPYRFVRHP
jgi:protein-S-isoprenylcysteine O-methyltransferase Ste14